MLVQELGITVVPLTVRFGQESYRDGIDMDNDQFFARLEESLTMPATSQPPVGDFLRVYRQMVERGDQVLSIHISSRLSGTYQSALTASQEVGVEGSLRVMDSFTGSMGTGFAVLAAVRAARSGASLKEAAQAAQDTLRRTRTYLMVDTLKYLEMGGRIGKAQALLGSLLQVKPILAVRDGEIVPLKQVRTRPRALEALYSLVEDSGEIEEAAVVYTTTPEEAQELARRLETKLPRERILVSTCCAVIGAHIGPGAMGVIVVTGHP